MTRFHQATIATFMALACGGCAAQSDAGTGTAPTGAAQAPDLPPEAAAASPDDGSSFARARTLPLGGEVSVSHDTKGDRFFVVAIPEGSDGILSIAAEDTPAGWDPAVTVFDGAEKAIDRIQSSGPSAAARRETSIAASGGHVYYVKAHGRPTTAPYRLRASFIAVDDAFEPNDDLATARPVRAGEPIDVHLFAGHDTNAGVDADFFRIATDGSGTIRIRLENGSRSESQQAFTATVIGLGSASSTPGGDLDATFAVPAGAREVVVGLTGSSSPHASKATFSVY